MNNIKKFKEFTEINETNLFTTIPMLITLGCIGGWGLAGIYALSKEGIDKIKELIDRQKIKPLIDKISNDPELAKMIKTINLPTNDLDSVEELIYDKVKEILTTEEWKSLRRHCEFIKKEIKKIETSNLSKIKNPLS